MIAFHTKHIMGAPSVKAGLLLRVGFIELGQREAGPEEGLEGAGSEGSGGDSAPPAGTPPPRGWPCGRESGSQRLAGPSADSPARPRR